MSNVKLLLLTTLLLTTLVLTTTYGSEELKGYLSTFVEPTCCFTNNCCFMIQSNELTDLGEGKYLIHATQEVVSERGKSPDGQYWRCACDQLPEGGYEKANPLAKTRCLYTPVPGF